MPDDNQLLRIAIPNKGSLSQAASDILREAGYKQRSDSKQLTLTDSDNGVEFFYLRPRDIALYVGEGTLDIGITGRDLLLDSGAKAEEVLQLGFGRSLFRFAARPGIVNSTADLAGKRIATSYDGVVTAYLQAGLEIVGEPILESEAVLITRSGASLPAGFEVFQRRVEGVLVARSYVMMDYDILEERVEQAVALTPGIESPTVSPLHREGWVAVRSMVPRAKAQRVMDELYELGARGILTTDIHACRL
jgi:ATP phosphoribosyltransferase